MIIHLTQISIFGLVAIAVERFVAIKYPLLHRRSFTSKVAWWLIVGDWLIGSIVGLIPMMGWNLGEPPYKLQYCSFMDVIDMGYWIYVVFFGSYFITLGVIFLIYLYMLHVVWTHGKQFSQQAQSQANNPNQSKYAKEMKAARNVFIIIITFALCWLPIHMYNTLNYFYGLANFPVVLTCVFLSHANSAINPLLYAYTNRKIKDAMIHWLTLRRLKKPRDQTSVSGTSEDQTSQQTEQTSSVSFQTDPQQNDNHM